MPSTPSRPLRVLHIVGNMNRGGVETWLMHLLRRIDRSQVQMDFVVSNDGPCHYAAEIDELGSPRVSCRFTWNGLFQDLRRLVQDSGPVDIVHAHMQFFNAIPLAAAASCGVPVRISHSHLDTRREATPKSWPRRVYERASQRFGARFSTHRLGCSTDACESLFGSNWAADPRCRLFNYGLDFRPFGAKIERQAARARFGLHSEHIVFGHVGRFCPQKNQLFLLRAFCEVIRELPLARLLLVGHGPDHEAIASQIERLGLQQMVQLLEPTSDVPALMLGVMDAFVFPSVYEGLGLALVEAQAAGLPCLTSDRIPLEADVVPPLVTRMSLEAGPEAWANGCLKIVREPRQIAASAALAQILDSQFNIERSSLDLLNFYNRALNDAGQDRRRSSAA